MFITLKNAINCFGTFLFDAGKWRAFVFLLSICVLFKSNFQLFFMTGSSMYPKYPSFKMFMISNFEKNTIGIKVRRFDIVVFKDDEGDLVVKRILGMPNETVRMRLGIVYVNGEEKDYPIVSLGNVSMGMSCSEYKLGEGEYFYVGDNRAVSTFGKIKHEDIIGVVE